jgi:ribosomal-protein-alanine N-acetyltransferase
MSGLPRTARLDAELPDPANHLDFAEAHFKDPLIAPWHGGGPRDCHRMLVAHAAQAAETGWCLWWWRERSTGALVGYAGLNRDEVDGEDCVEVGWSVTPSRWGEGFAPEAARASIECGFEHGLARIVSFTMIENERSRRVMEKLGMTYVRDFERADAPHVLYEIRNGSTG